jgi:hypothetical protein
MRYKQNVKYFTYLFIYCQSDIFLIYEIHREISDFYSIHKPSTMWNFFNRIFF